VIKDIPQRPKERSDSYTVSTDKIMASLNHSDFKGHAYERVSIFVDTFGPRLYGSQNLEDALVFMKNELEVEGFENVKLENVPLKRRWVRGQEELTLLDPRPFPTRVPMIGLGGSVGGNITAEVVLVDSMEDMDTKGDKGLLQGKIALFDYKWTTYGEDIKFRTNGPTSVSKYGAVACIIRSLASKSIESPHTGITFYDEKYPKIPAAAISVEDTDMIARMINRGQVVKLNIYMEGQWEEGEFMSHNLIGEITGSQFPEEILLLGGHIDSWDTGPQTGANDDATGFMVCYEAVRMLIKNGLRPKRTIRFIAWTGEEFGSKGSGAEAYLESHKDEMDNHIVAFESDGGTTDIYGFGFNGGNKGYNLVWQVANLFLKEHNCSQIMKNHGGAADTAPLYERYKIPTMNNLVKDTADAQYYMSYHHSAGDSISVLNPDEMDRNAAAIASLFYILADVPWRLPRD
jgi:carboxypeptidase Q